MGIEPDEGAHRAAVEFVEQEGMSDRIDVHLADAVDFLKSGEVQVDLALLCFVIHEVLGQRGEQGVRELLGALFESSPDAELIVIDVDHRLADRERMRHPLAQTYYNGYFLLHPFTQQRLEPIAYWERLYEDCGLEVVERLATDEDLDSTGFEVGWLLRRRGA
jgi:2-ketoarginine methyltransferase